MFSFLKDIGKTISTLGSKPKRRKSRKPKKITKAQWKTYVSPTIKKAKRNSYKVAKRKKY